MRGRGRGRGRGREREGERERGRGERVKNRGNTEAKHMDGMIEREGINRDN